MISKSDYHFATIKLKTMNHQFQLKPIQATEVSHLFQLNDQELSKLNAKRIIVNEQPGFPCRISLEDATVGEEVILFSYKNHDVDSPYKSEGPVFVRKNAVTATLAVNEIPIMLHHRLLSLRAYDKDAMMIHARTVEGKVLSNALHDIFEREKVKYVHIHNSGPGCYNCRVERVL